MLSQKFSSFTRHINKIEVRVSNVVHVMGWYIDDL